MPDIKPHPHRDMYLESLRRMTSEQRLRKAFELSEMSKELFRQGLRRRYPNLSDEEFHRVFLEHLEQCNNRNY
jgi:hypothetical protein